MPAKMSSALANDALACDPVAMQQQLAVFVRDGVLESAQLLGELLLALAAAPPTDALRTHIAAHLSNAQLADGDKSRSHTPAAVDAADLARAFHAQTHLLFADLLVAKREFKRAIQYYKRHWKLVAGSSCTSSSDAVTPESVAVKTKIAQCWLELETPHHALEILNSIPTHARTLRVHLLLGKVYRDEGVLSQAEECYTLALRLNPYALEAAVALAELSVSTDASAITHDSSNAVARPREIETFYSSLATQQQQQQGPSLAVAPSDTPWMQVLVRAHVHTARGRYRASLDAFDALERVFPANLHCLLAKAQVEMAHEFYHQAHVQFHRARQVDDQSLALMDRHADCLRKSNARTQLSALVHDLFDTSDAHAEVWLAAAYYSDLKGEHETALQFCERAIALDRRHAAAHLFRGTLLLTLQRPEHALVAFTTSCKLAQSLDAYAGMISSYCDLCAKGSVAKYKDAVATAKAVVKRYPHRAHSFTLLGSVFALRPENKEHARKAFQRALTLEPRKLAAVFGLVDLLVHEGNFSAAIDKLTALSEQHAREEVFTKLGDLYAMTKQFGEAMAQYHRSLSLNPASADALRGLDRLEKLMRGEDPDELNSTMDHLDPDDGDDSMEAGEYVNA